MCVYNLQDCCGRTPLLAALQAKRQRVAKHVLAKYPLHVGLACKDMYGCSVLHYLHLLKQNKLSQMCGLFKQTEEQEHVVARVSQSQQEEGNEPELLCSHNTGRRPPKEDRLDAGAVWGPRLYESVRPYADARFLCPKCGEHMFGQLAKRHQQRCVTSPVSQSTNEKVPRKGEGRCTVKKPPFVFHQDRVLSGQRSSPLFAAVVRNDLAALKFLWKCNVSFENDSSDNRNLLEFAIDCLKPEVASFLLTDRGMKSDDDKTCLVHRCVSAQAWTEAEKKAQFEILHMLCTADGCPTWTSQGHDACRQHAYNRERNRCMQSMFAVLARNWSGELIYVKYVIEALVRIDQIGVLEQAIVEGHSAMVEWCVSCIRSTRSTSVLSAIVEQQLVYMACTAKRKVVKIMKHILQLCPRVLASDQTTDFANLMQSSHTKRVTTDEATTKGKAATKAKEEAQVGDIVAKGIERKAAKPAIQKARTKCKEETEAAAIEKAETGVQEADKKCKGIYWYTPLEWLMNPVLVRSPDEDREYDTREDLGCFLIETNLNLDIIRVDDTGRSIHASCVALSLAVNRGYWKIAESLLQHGAADIFWTCVHGGKQTETLCTACYNLSAQAIISDLCRPNAPINLLQTFLSLRPKETVTSQPDTTSRSVSSSSYWVPSLNPTQLCELVELSRIYPRVCPTVCCDEFTYAPRGLASLDKTKRTTNWSVLHEACSLGDETLHKVLRTPNEPNVPSPLALAARNGSVTTVEMLLARGAQPTWKDVADSFDHQCQRESTLCI